jgi:hypothetical protein
MILFPAVKQPGHEAIHSPPSSAYIKNDDSYIPVLTDMPSQHDASFYTVTLLLPFGMQLQDAVCV